MAETIPQTLQSNKLVLNGNVYSVGTEVKPDITFKDKETEQLKTAHKTVLSQASPFFTTWFKEQWQQDKPSDEYPLPGDIDWEVFTTIISILYGEEVKFEEEALPDLFKAADYLQLDTLKVAIVVSLTEEWQVKSEPLLLSMCTAVASQADKNILSYLLYMASLRFLIQNLQLLVKSGSEVIPTLPYGTIAEIARSEEVTAPEINLYLFLKIWCEGRQKEVTLNQINVIFSHIRYATIPHDDLERITLHTTNNHKNLWSAYSTCPEFGAKAEIDAKQFTTRIHQQPVLLLNSPTQKKWTKFIKAQPSHIDDSSDDDIWTQTRKQKATVCYSDQRFYSIASSSKSSIITVFWNKDSCKSICCTISTLLSRDQEKLEKCLLKIEAVPNKVVVPTYGVNILTTATGIAMRALAGNSAHRAVTYDQPRPWLLTIECNCFFTAQTM